MSFAENISALQNSKFPTLHLSFTQNRFTEKTVLKTPTSPLVNASRTLTCDVAELMTRTFCALLFCHQTPLNSPPPPQTHTVHNGTGDARAEGGDGEQTTESRLRPGNSSEPEKAPPRPLRRGNASSCSRVYPRRALSIDLHILRTARHRHTLNFSQEKKERKILRAKTTVVRAYVVHVITRAIIEVAGLYAQVSSCWFSLRFAVAKVDERPAATFVLFFGIILLKSL